MTDLIRDTALGHIVRFASRGRHLRYQEEIHPELWSRFINEKKSGHMAHHGTVDPLADDSDAEEAQMQGIGGVRTREARGEYVPAVGDEKTSGNGSANKDVEDSESSSRTRLGDKEKGVGIQRNLGSGMPIDVEKGGRDLNIIDWWGEKDPENPVNWSKPKKFFVTFNICLLTTSVYIGSSIYTAGLQDISRVFGVSDVAAEVGLTLFVLGYGLGPMLWSPMSEIPQIGRNPIYISTLLVFVLLQLPVGYAKNFGMLMAFRFLTGFIGSPCLATGGATLADMYEPKTRAYAIGIWGISAVCGPVLGPLVGGFAAEAKGWQWPIWELTWLASFSFVFLFCFLPETSSANILYRRTKRLRKATGNDKLKCEPELAGENMTGKDILMMVVVRPITLNFLEPMVFFLNLYIALIYGLLYIWFESFPIVFVDIYGFSLGKEGLAFIGILVGAFLTIPPFYTWMHYYLEPRFDANGNLRPEERLPPAFVGGFAIPICLFWFGWSAGHTHWIMPIIGSAWFSVGAFLLFNSVLNYLPDAYPAVAASVLAGNDFMRSSFGAAFPLFARAMYTNLGVGWASSLLAFLGIAFIPIPFVLYRYGEGLRKNRSKFARKDI